MKIETHETLEAYGLAAIGAVKGLAEIASEGFQDSEPNDSRSASLAWAGLIGGVALADRYLVRHGSETLTNRAHRAEHPLLVKTAAVVTALHIANWLPERIDPIHQFGKRSGWLTLRH